MEGIKLDTTPVSTEKEFKKDEITPNISQRYPGAWNPYGHQGEFFQFPQNFQMYPDQYHSYQLNTYYSQQWNDPDYNYNSQAQTWQAPNWGAPMIQNANSMNTPFQAAIGEKLNSQVHDEKLSSKTDNGEAFFHKAQKKDRSSRPSIYSQWETDEFLPDGWKKRSYRTKIATNRMATKWQFLSPLQKIFPSRSQVIEYMIKSGIYSEDDILKAKNGSCRPDRVAAGLERKSKNMEGIQSDETKMQDYSITETNSQKGSPIKVDADLNTPQLTDGSRFQCTQCPQVLEHQASLKRHMGIHTGENTFMCHICYENLSQKAGLIRHMRIHTGERPYVCKECDMTFSQNTGLIRHSRRHTGERPFPCPYPGCSMSFAQSSTQKRHSSLHEFKDTKVTLKTKLNNELERRNKIERSEWQIEDALPYGWKKRSFKNNWNKDGEHVLVTRFEYLSPSEKIFSKRVAIIDHMEDLPSVYSDEQILKFKNSHMRGKKGKICDNGFNNAPNDINCLTIAQENTESDEKESNKSNIDPNNSQN